MFSSAAMFAGGVLCANIAMSLKLPRLIKADLPIDNLPEHIRGLKILHVSDIHNKSKYYVNVNIWKTVFKEDFDIAVITGDMTKDFFDQVLPLREPLSELASRVPTFFVDGNHEKAHFREMKKFMESLGVVVLDDRKITLGINGGSLEILGIRDYYYQKRQGFKPFKHLMEDEVKCGFRILLSHQPQIIEGLSYFKDILVLSGHTHGGQIRLPFVDTIIAPGQGFFPKFGDGFYKVKNCYLYISRGIGASRIPVRLFNRPEVAVLTLKNSAGGGRSDD
ncbi:MAG: metallophosphoesterase [Defluviitaleaceae bacterium]|nr:metallophosphoesterase [Defluviitaleaceae bacterium]